ncbi:Metallo-dependent phosphatase-like protein [Syncephalastrum racemosum]|uniref:Metallo-dependent phosphatase-like protein n=1 Tax=Syncephalastrum racemosum TaxID=13706 RepID=A0A1X2H3Q2_SYNRA|nr:Metallo-dependent phosphatase-like protein [Syncephalastrum racemosum]
MLLYCFSTLIHIYWAFLRIKLDNALFDSRWIPCGVLRKEPILYVQDTDRVQVVWEMNCGTKAMTVEWRTTPESAFAATEPVDPVVLDSRHSLYKATIGPLKGDAIEYRILDHRRRLTARHVFRWHATNSRQPIRMAAVGDNQFGLRTFVSLLRKVPAVDYVLHVGDAVQNYPSLRQWQTDFVGPLTHFGLGQTTPLIYAHGNHDHDPTYEYHYTRHSDVSTDPWYAFSLADGAIRFVVLDSNLDWQQQDDWLQRELASDAFQSAQLRLVVVHVPPFVEYWDPDGWFKQKQSEWGAFIKDRFVPLFEQYGVDLVISGHQHNYERGERNGVHYTIIGGAGGDLDFDRVVDWHMYESIHLVFHYVLMEFRPPQNDHERWSLVWNTYGAEHGLIDSITIRASPRARRTGVEERPIGAVAGEAIEELTFQELEDTNPLGEPDGDEEEDPPE